MDWIAFPKIGWRFNISDEIFRIPLGDNNYFSLKWYGLIIAVGFLLAIIYAYKRADYFKIDRDRMIDVVLVSALFAFVGARLYYVLFSGELDKYLADPLSILAVWEGGLGIYGGVIFAFGTALWMCRVRKVNTRSMFDLASLGFLIGQGIGRWGNFFNQEAYGCNTDLPWGMTGSKISAGQNLGTVDVPGFDPSLPVHPTFLYESLWCLLGFVLLHIISKKFYKFKGQIFAMYMIWYGAGRFWIESLRTDSLYLGTMRVSQLVAVLSVIGGIILLFVFKSYAEHLPKTLAVETQEDELVLVDGEAAGNGEADTADEEADAAAEDGGEPAEEQGETEISQEDGVEEPPAEENTAEEPSADSEGTEDEDKKE